MVAAAVPWSLLLLLLLCRVWSGSERALWQSRRGRQWHDAAAARPADPAAAAVRRRAAASGGERRRASLAARGAAAAVRRRAAVANERERDTGLVGRAAAAGVRRRRRRLLPLGVRRLVPARAQHGRRDVDELRLL